MVTMIRLMLTDDFQGGGIYWFLREMLTWLAYYTNIQSNVMSGISIFLIVFLFVYSLKYLQFYHEELQVAMCDQYSK